MKRIISLIIVSLLLVWCLTLPAYAVSFDDASLIPLRAGGGGGGGSGGSGGGGGGSGGGGHAPHGTGTGRQPTLVERILQPVIFVFFAFSSTILFYIQLSKRSRKAKKLMKLMMQSDNAWKYENISLTVEECYMAVQTAWMNMDMTPVRHYMSDELFESFQIKLNWMSYRNERNVMENIQLLKALPVAVYDDLDNSRDFIWFYIKGRMVDYTIDVNTQLKTEGSTSPASFVEYWQFTRKEDAWVLNKILQKDEAHLIPFTE